MAGQARESCERQVRHRRGPHDDGHARLHAISEKHPLYQCRHFVAACCIAGDVAAGSDSSEEHSFQSYYASLGVCLLGTVLDGDCAFDVMTQMLGLPGTFEARCKLRVDISDYLIDRARQPSMRQMMLACSELEPEDVLLCRDGTIELDDC